MRQDDNNRGCLSRESLEILAIRISQGKGTLEKPGEGSPEFLPADLFQPDEEEMRLHLEECPACRKRLLEEVYSISRYLEGLDNKLNDKRFDILMERMRSRASVTQHEYLETVLYYDIGGRGEEHVSLAAASNPESQQETRFSSEDGTMILKFLPGPGSELTRIQLIADNTELVKGAEVIIGNVTLFVDKSGMIECPDSDIHLSDDTSIKVRSKLT